VTELQTILEQVGNQSAERQRGCLSMRSERLLVSEIGRLQRELRDWQDSSEAYRADEKRLSDAYLRLRALIPGAFDTPHAPSSEQVWATTENALRNSLNIHQHREEQ
jgi:hypothetical protein